jgi:hypothetical protein
VTTVRIHIVGGDHVDVELADREAARQYVDDVRKNLAGWIEVEQGDERVAMIAISAVTFIELTD